MRHSFTTIAISQQELEQAIARTRAMLTDATVIEQYSFATKAQAYARSDSTQPQGDAARLTMGVADLKQSVFAEGKIGQ